MSDTDSDELFYPGLSESESEHPGTSSVASTQQLGVNVCRHSVYPHQDQPHAKVRSTPSTRSAYYPGNRGGRVPPREADSCKGEEFLETPTLTTPGRNTPPTFTCHRGWAMGRGRGVRLEGAKISTVGLLHKNDRRKNEN